MSTATKTKQVNAEAEENGKDTPLANQTEKVKPVKEKVSGAGQGVTKKLLVMSDSETFSDELIEYSLNMARRMKCEIIALNTVPLKNECVNRMSALKDSVCERFETDATKNAGGFQSKAKDLSIGFTHKVTFYPADEAVLEIEKTVGKIDLVVAEALEDKGKKAKKNSKAAPKTELIVYAPV